MAAYGVWQRYFRIRKEASFNAASPGSRSDWNHGAGGAATGWFDLPVIKDSDGLQPKSTIIYPGTMAGTRAMNPALPVAGAYPTELGNLEMPYYPEMCDRLLQAVFGGVARTETAGSAALASTAYGSLATLTAQPTGDEQLKFVIASSTAASAAIISIIEGSTTVETITIGTSVATVDGAYYSKGGWGAGGTITFSIAGTVSSGMVVVSGIKSVSTVHSVATTTPTFVIEQGGRKESDANSEFLSGVVIPTIVLSYDRSAPDSMLMLNATAQGIYGTATTPTTYGNEAAKFYQPFAAWTGNASVDGSAWAEVVSAQITIQPNTQLYAVSSGSQNPSAKVEGEMEVFGTMTIIPAASTRWTDYRASTVRNVELEFLTPFFVNGATPYRLFLEMTQCTFSDYTRNRQNQAQGAELGFRAIYNTTDGGPAKVTSVCRLPL